MDTTEPPLKDGVVAVITDSHGKMLLIKRGLTLPRAPGWWCFVGGEVEAGEKYEDAIEREVREEVGLIVEARGKVHETISPNGEFRLHWMKVELVSNPEQIALHPVEVAEARWLSADDALRLDPMLPALTKWLLTQRR